MITGTLSLIRLATEAPSNERASTTSKTGYAALKFSPSEDDPTGGEWARCKVMEIWLSIDNPLTEPKWARGNLRDNIDPSSTFHNIIHVTDVDAFHPVVPSFEDN